MQRDLQRETQRNVLRNLRKMPLKTRDISCDILCVCLRCHGYPSWRSIRCMCPPWCER